ncbi:secreted RxLR effector protein 161-like [Mercurialis annua]|uniref:secreted RxLR effector protein 161-like n=1 Tax=Mercurialis annua TaxID=3986 RepID=UPI0021604371|nr:secreted RxLR effector protein 161-like [Mercurialis annua]
MNILGPEVPYLNTIGAFMYLDNFTRPDISFSVNLLSRFSSSPMKRHWNIIKYIFRYLHGSTDLDLFYSNDSKLELIGYADVDYLFDPHTIRFQTRCVFTSGATSSNHVELIALHEASRECEGYVESDRTKHIPMRFVSYTQELINNQEIDIQYVQSNDNSSDIFTKLLPTAIFRKHVHNIGMRHLRNM